MAGDKITEAVRILAALVGVAQDPTLLSALKAGPGLRDSLKKLAASPPASFARLAEDLGQSASTVFAGLREKPRDAEVLYLQMVEAGLPDPARIMANRMVAASVTEGMLAGLTEREHRDPAMQALFRALTQPALERLLADKAFAADLTPAFMRAVLENFVGLAEKLDNISRQGRDVLETLAVRFEIEKIFDLSDTELRRQLELRAEDYRRYRAQIEAIDERMAGLGDLKAAAQEAAERLDFAEVEALLSQVHMTELEVAAETALVRADTALLRGRSEQAFDLLSAAAYSFGGVDRLEPARRLIDYEDVLYFHGRRYGGASLAFAVRMLRRALEDIDEENAPEAWSNGQYKLGNALSLEGGRIGGAEGTKLLVDAAQAHKAAQRVWTEERAPESWAMVQNNLSATVFLHSMQVGGFERIRLLQTAAKIAREAARVWFNVGNFEQSARAQTNLGNALAASGGEMSGAEGVQILSEAVEAFRGALLIRTKDEYPLERAHTQHNLGTALWDRGRRMDGLEGDWMLREAVQVLNEALLTRTEAGYPLYWAMTQNSLGIALTTQGEQTAGQEGVQLFTKAIEAFEAALRIHTEAEHPVPWASATRNLGHAHESLADHGSCPDPRAALEAAAERFTDALRIYDPETMPFDHARATDSLARVRSKLAALPDPA